MIVMEEKENRAEMGGDANLCAWRNEVDSLGGRRSVRRCDELMQRYGIGVECAVKKQALSASHAGKPLKPRQ